MRSRSLPLKNPPPYNAFIGLRFTRFNFTRLKIYFKRKLALFSHHERGEILPLWNRLEILGF
ncbi:hypothetical protein HW260_04520 [Helicobacter cinaedi]|uniref:hypothetical protein n=1 Tax=Helicobacter cinaedi TaxID=213 RepID=UPI0002E00E6B|nr:hypothetical protein [Helicobacter cinaedi]QOQ91575.1 hypothetical protein HW260_04520 [Helicobacter cinaedi]QOQ95773.1 hypothetical protein HW245_09255 [Helicobacter cinaedi]